jgi:hypothetical protein
MRCDTPSSSVHPTLASYKQRRLTMPACRAAIREELEDSGVEDAKTDSRLTLEFMGGARGTLLPGRRDAERRPRTRWPC